MLATELPGEAPPFKVAAVERVPATVVPDGTPTPVLAARPTVPVVRAVRPAARRVGP